MKCTLKITLVVPSRASVRTTFAICVFPVALPSRFLFSCIGSVPSQLSFFFFSWPAPLPITPVPSHVRPPETFLYRDVCSITHREQKHPPRRLRPIRLSPPLPFPVTQVILCQLASTAISATPPPVHTCHQFRAKIASLLPTFFFFFFFSEFFFFFFFWKSPYCAALRRCRSCQKSSAHIQAPGSSQAPPTTFL